MKYYPLRSSEKIEEYQLALKQGSGEQIPVGSYGKEERNNVVAVNMDDLVKEPFNFNLKQRVYAYVRARNGAGWGPWTRRSRKGILM